jgi:thiamine-phosphate pyrophosphorylase
MSPKWLDIELSRLTARKSMVPQLYLITPSNPDLTSFPKTLMAVLNAAEFSALLVRRGSMDDAAYARFAAEIINVGQGAGCAVLVEDDTALAKRLGADGVHVSGGAKAVQEAAKALKPSMIVGAGNLGSRHDAMTAGESDVDYVFFGSLDGKVDPHAVELAQWWSETFEVPAVLSDPEALPQAATAHGAEFLALSTSIWSAPDPKHAVRTIIEALEETA